ncbi:MAG: hypothetical protein J0H19_12410 [Rhodospirillales bacterium]|nr:hypothetical protein [Rhodospirillales bacterium]
MRTVFTWLSTFFANDRPGLSAEDVAHIRQNITALRDEARVSNQAVDQALADAAGPHSRIL